MMTAEMFKPNEHYSMVCEWWMAAGWPQGLPLTHLPETGFLISFDDVPACAGFLYKTDSAFCWFDFVVANPAIRRKQRSECLSFLFELVKTAAKAMGFKMIIHSVRNVSLVARLEKAGFQSTEKNVTNLTYNLTGEL